MKIAESLEAAMQEHSSLMRRHAEALAARLQDQIDSIKLELEEAQKALDAAIAERAARSKAFTSYIEQATQQENVADQLAFKTHSDTMARQVAQLESLRVTVLAGEAVMPPSTGLSALVVNTEAVADPFKPKDDGQEEA